MGARIASQAATAQAPLARGVVLLVDEDATDLQQYTYALERRGFNVRSCTRYSDGVRSVESQPFDLIVVCQERPEFEGRRVLEKARQLGHREPVLVLTRCPEMHSYLEAMQLGALDYIEKPRVASQIAWLVETYLRPLSSESEHPADA